MAQSTGQEKTQPPTPRRISKARGQGQLPRSQELPSAFTLLMLLGVLFLSGPHLFQWFTMEVRQGLACRYGIMVNNKAFIDLANKTVISSALVTAPFFLAFMIAGAAGCIVVSGFHYTPKALKLKFNVIHPISGLKQLVSVRSLIRLLLATLKLFFITIIVYFYLRDKLDTLAALRWAWSMQILTQMARLIVGVALRIGLVVLLLAIAEAFYRKWKWKHDLKMTQKEVKDERKDTEGSPEVKRRIRQAQFEMARARMLQEVPKANVVLVNPQHVAVALQYDRKTMDAPMVVAKGADYLSEKIREIARAHGVPIIRRPELARTLYSTVEVGQAIPDSLFVAVAEVLALIHRLRHRK